MHLTYELKREVLNDVHDAGGTWQFEGGEALENQKVVGHYAAERRVVFKATEAQNTAMLRLTLFFLDQEPPENLTLEGSHDFNSGSELGSVSAASRAFSAHIGKQFQRVGDTLTIG
jgi:hypothetical protein